MNILRIILRAAERARDRFIFYSSERRMALSALCEELEAEIKALEKEEAKGS